MTDDVTINWLSPTMKEESTTSNAYTSRSVFDPLGRLIFEGTKDNTSLQWRSTEHRYDLIGRRVFSSYVTDADNSQLGVSNNVFKGITYEYDGLNRLTKETQEMGAIDSVRGFDHDVDTTGNLKVTTTDGKLKVTTSIFESFGSPNYQYRLK